MRDAGYIKIYRDIRDWQFWDKPRHTAVWVHLLVDANWKDNAWKYGKPLKRGELIISQRAYAERCGIDRKTLMTILKDFEEAGQLITEAGPEGTRIQILNYEKYQDGVGVNSTTNWATDSTTVGEFEGVNSTTNWATALSINDKKERTKKKNVYGGKPPTLDQIREYIYTENLMVDPDRFFDYYESQGWKLSNGNKMKDWKASCRNWHRKEVEKMNQEKKKGLAF